MSGSTPLAALAILAGVATLAAGSGGWTAEEDARCNGDAATITGSGVIRGTRGNDVIIGSPAPDTIYGGGGKDAICALGGDDRIDGGHRGDYLSGGTGHDRITGGAGNDGVDGDDGQDVLDGNAGDDGVDAGAGHDRVLGGPGDDSLNGNNGRDRLGGEAGNDTLTGDGALGVIYSAGDDEFELASDDLGGGPGIDEVHYGHEPVTVTLDGRRNDGARREQDWVRGDVEGAYVRGGTIIGNAGPNTLSGAGKISGLGGADRLIGSGRGRFHGGPGNDRVEKAVEVSEGAHLYGDAGNDTIDGTDVYYPSDGRDVNAVRDWISCGSGRDHAILYFDVARRDCERVEGQRYGEGR